MQKSSLCNNTSLEPQKTIIIIMALLVCQLPFSGLVGVILIIAVSGHPPGSPGPHRRPNQGQWEGSRQGPPSRRPGGCGRPRNEFVEQSLVTELIDNQPKGEIQVQYPLGGKVNFGNELVPYQVRNKPNVTYAADPKKLYTLVMVDAGPKGDKSGGGFAHWLVGNIPGNNVSAGEDVGYAGAMPPKGEAPHRYTFLLYEQPGKVQLTDVNRMPLNVRDFQKKLNLGQPIAANFFLAQADDYSELAAKQMQPPKQ